MKGVEYRRGEGCSVDALGCFLMLVVLALILIGTAVLFKCVVVAWGWATS